MALDGKSGVIRDVRVKSEPIKCDSCCDIWRCVIVIALINTCLLQTSVDAVIYLGNEAIWRENEDQVKKAIFIVDPTQRLLTDGTIVGWSVYTTRGRRSQVVYLQIWRPVSPAENRYLRVGETGITALWVGYNHFTLYPADRIPVRRGDVLGIYFPSYNPIPWASMPCRSQGSEHLFKYNPSRLHSTSNEMAFERGSSDSNPCRKYSLNATIMDDDEVKLFDYDYQETTDGRYDKRPYGKYVPTKRFAFGRSTSLLRHPTMAVLLASPVLFCFH